MQKLKETTYLVKRKPKSASHKLTIMRKKIACFYSNAPQYCKPTTIKKIERREPFWFWSQEKEGFGKVHWGIAIRTFIFAIDTIHVGVF